jgi:NCS1 family nucleobase:cation symporter-1
MNNRMSPELLPSTAQQRTLTTFDLAILCAAMVVNVVGLIIPTQIFFAGMLSPQAILLCALLGFSLVACLITLTGDIGTRYGVPFTLFIRDCFGLRGAIVGSLARAAVCVTWCGIITWLGASAINTILETWLGFSHFWIVFAIFAGCQIVNASRGVKSMSRFGWLAIPLLALMLCAMVLWLLKTHDITVLTVFERPPEPPTPDSFTLFGAISVFAGGWLSEALNGSDLSRKLRLAPNGPDASFFMRNRAMIIAFFTGFIISGLVLSGTGLISGVLSGHYDPVEMMKVSFREQPLILVIGCLTLVVAQWSTNTCANIFPATLVLLNLCPRLSFAAATWIVGLISILLMPWLLMAHLAWVQILFSACLAPILGIMLVHYYIILRGHVDVAALYDSEQRRWRVNGMLALAIGIISGIVFRDQAFFVAFPVASLSYGLLVRIRGRER